MKRLASLLLACATTVALADEGMWTYNDFPAVKVKEKYGFAPTKEWLDHVRLSSARLAGGCSGSFVSSNGLVMTNHHCAHRCIEQLSNAKRDFVASGFYAKTEGDEVTCPEIEVNQLTDISDVTDRISAVTKGVEGQKYHDILKAEMSKIEKDCATSDAVRCDVVSLYHGGKYNLYKYRRFQDVRLAFAPEFAIAFFGGDPDNFNFPRYDLDVTFLRVYDGGKPAKIDHYLKWNEAGVKEGDLTFVSGNPGKTSRLLTLTELEYERDVALPTRLLYLAELRGMIREFQNRGAEQKRYSTSLLFGVENSVKALRGRHLALLDKEFFAKKVAAEQSLRSKVNQDPAKKAAYGNAWDGVARGMQQLGALDERLNMIEHGRGFQSQTYKIAQTLVRGGDELPKPNEKRLREFVDSKLPELRQHLFSKAPLYDDFEIATLSWSLTKLREVLGPDDDFVKKVLGKQTPTEVATALVKGTKLKDVALRQQLFKGGKQAVEASNDPMIQFARMVDAEARPLRDRLENDIEPLLKKSEEQIARAGFDIYGTSVYPDATFTLRLSYGTVKGYADNGKEVKPLTYMGGTFERASGKEPFALPRTWLAAQSKLDAQTPMNVCTDNDIIGGNSGSPLINKDGEVVGLVFDGNIQSLGGEYGFDQAVNRTVSVHAAALTQALDKIYGAHRILTELRGTPRAAGQGAGSK